MSNRRITVISPATSSPGWQLGEECVEIQRELKMAPHRNDFRSESRWVVGVEDLMRHLNELERMVVHFSVHFSGHGGRAG